jgi:arsenite methyltransferase
MALQRPDYGIDAPHVIRNLMLVFLLGLIAFLTAHFGLWSGVLLYFDIGHIGLGTGLCCGAIAAWMLYDSKVGKLKEREMLLDLAELHAEDCILDVGCGRGLLLIGAAKRLREGQATGLDLWNAEDLTGNTPTATLENARRESVTDRVKVETGDMRKMPFPADTFDAVLSNMAIHNIYDVSGRIDAIREIVRVLKPGGRIVIHDIRHIAEYSKELSESGMTDIRDHSSQTLRLSMSIFTFGSLRPGLLTARRP